MNSALVDLQLLRGQVRAEVPMSGFSRISDVLNNLPGGYLSGVLRGLDGAPDGSGPAQVVHQRRELVVRLRDVLLVRPVDERPGSPAGEAERRDRLEQRMVLDLAGWRVAGAVHLVDRVRWVDFMATTSSRFLAVTGATISPPEPAQAVRCPFLLVNGARVSALYEEP